MVNKRADNYQDAALRLKIVENAKATAMAALEAQYKGKADADSKAELLVGTKRINNMDIQSTISERFHKGWCLVCGEMRVRVTDAYPCEDSTYFYLCEKHAHPEMK